MMIRLSDVNPSNLPVSMSELETALANLSDGVIVVDAASGRLIYWNRTAVSLLGDSDSYSEYYDSYITGAFHSSGHPYQPHEFPIARALAGEPVTSAEVVYPRHGGPALHLSMSAIPIRDKLGTVTKAAVTFSDISLQRQTEHTLQDTRQLFSRTLRCMNMTHWVLDIPTGRTQIDATWFGLLGYSPIQVKPTFNALLSILHPNDRARLLHQWDETLHNRTRMFDVSCRLRTAQHTWRWVMIRAEVSERTHSGKALRATGAILDIDRIKRVELALRINQDQFRLTFEHAAIGIAMLSPAGHWLSVNRKAGEILGYRTDELTTADSITRIVHPEAIESLLDSLSRLMKSPSANQRLELRCIHGKGHTIWIALTLSAVANERGQSEYLIAILEDKTDSRHTSEQLEKAQAQLRMATRIAGLGFWEWDLGSDIITCSEESMKQFGLTEEALRNGIEGCRAYIHPEDCTRVFDYLYAYVDAPHSDYVQEFRMRQHDGSYIWICVRGMAVLDQHGRLQKIVGTHLDITEQKHAQEDVRQRAQHDPLTGLPNRGLLYEFAEHLVASARRASAPLAVLFIDLDHFKMVNDSYGHQVGDRVLQEVATRLSQLIRAEDVIGRLGGDEFVAILPKITSSDDAAVVAIKALDSLRQPYHVGGLDLTLSPSIGISLFPKDGDNIDLLIQHADAAMYQVKHSERNNFCFYVPDSQHNVNVAADLEARLRTALERGEFIVHYQPIVNTLNGTLLGVEALLRWPQHPGHQIEPSIFIPAAETSGLIVPLGEWLLHQACRQHREWLQHGLPPIPIAVNVSAVQLKRHEFQRSITAALHASGVGADFLEIELTENTVMSHPDNTIGILLGLRETGIKISLDNFGTGYLSLNQLSRLPIDKLKVDRSFVRHMLRDRSSLAVTSTIIAMGRSLGMDVIAGGIESGTDVQVLQQHDCHQGQGYHIGHPMSGDQLVQWYHQRSMH